MDFEEIQHQFDLVLKASNFGDRDPDTDKLFEQWFEAKKPFISKMGGLRWVSKEKISFPLDNDSKGRIFEHFIESAPYPVRDFLYAQGMNNFFNNNVGEKYTIYGSNFTIPMGMKIIKAFKYFFHNEEELRYWQDSASMILQTSKIEGYINLSVHPLDYLSVSENAHNWRSCHALDGEYRCGNLNYLVDPTTIVCYLTQDLNDDYEIPRFGKIKWNSKMWRVLLFFSDDGESIFAGRQYPFSSTVIMSYLLKTALFESSLLNKNHTYCDWTSWKANRVEFDQGPFTFGPDTVSNKLVPLGSFGRPLVAMNTIVKECDNWNGFNDLLRSSCYEAMYTTRIRPFVYSNPTKVVPLLHNKVKNFYIGKPAPCPCCGTDRPVAYTDVMACNRCGALYYDMNNEDYYRCSCCNSLIEIAEGDNVYSISHEDFFVCEDCYQNELETCSCCNEKFIKGTLRNLGGKQLCGWCEVDLRDVYVRIAGEQYRFRRFPEEAWDSELGQFILSEAISGVAPKDIEAKENLSSYKEKYFYDDNGNTLKSTIESFKTLSAENIDLNVDFSTINFANQLGQIIMNFNNLEGAQFNGS